MCVPLPVQGAGGCGNRDAVVFPGLEHQAERAAQLIQQGELAQQYGYCLLKIIDRVLRPILAAGYAPDNHISGPWVAGRSEEPRF